MKRFVLSIALALLIVWGIEQVFDGGDGYRNDRPPVEVAGEDSGGDRRKGLGVSEA